jgi:hypothetical protein
MFRDVTIHKEKQPAPILKAKLSVCVERSNNQGCRAARLDGSCAPRLFRTFGARYQPESSCPLVHQTQRVYVTVPKPHVGVKEAWASDLITGACGNGNRRLAVPAVSLQESRRCAVTEAFCDHSTHVGSAIHGRNSDCAGIVLSWYPGEGWSMTGRHELRAEVAGKEDSGNRPMCQWVNNAMSKSRSTFVHMERKPDRETAPAPHGSSTSKGERMVVDCRGSGS